MRYLTTLLAAVLATPTHAVHAAPVAAAPSTAMATPVPVPTAASHIGTWLTQSGNLEVDIAPCGAALCGTVVRVLVDRAMAGPGTTAGKPSAALGIKILRDFKPASGAEWKGHIFNRENGETYDCIMSMAVGGELKLHGYKFLRMFGQTQTWTRVAQRSTR